MSGITRHTPGSHTNAPAYPMRHLLTLSSLLCCIVALSLTLWIVVPAPLSRLWLVAVGAGEWSLWFGALGFLGVGLGLLASAAGARVPAWAALAAGVLAVAFAMYPPLSAWRVARANGVELSLREYLFGALKQDGARIIPQTITFAEVNSQTLKLDLYQPPGVKQTSRPAVVVVHGGSWDAGMKSDFPQWDRWLAEEGFVVFDVEYRLAPQPNWQTATGDVKCAVAWVRAHAADYEVDPQRIALLGRSAGAHLAMLAAYATKVAELPPSCETTAVDEPVQAVVSLYGTTDLLWGYAHPANQRVLDGPATLRRFLGGAPDDVPDAFRLASPVTHVNERTPPTLLFHGGHDQLIRDENMDLLTRRLATAGVPYRSLLLPYAQHGFDYNFHGWGSQLARPLLLDFLRTHLR